jgi:predicted double-glycine peptidase
MQQTHNSSCGHSTIAYAIDITFGIKPEKSRYIVPQM